MYDTVEERTEELAALMAEIWPEEAAPKPRRAASITVDIDMKDLMEKMFASSNGPKIKALYDGDMSAHSDDHSAADLALMDHGAYWFDCDAGAMDAFMRSSGLMRDKWDREDYRTATIQKAIADCRKTYQDKIRERNRERARQNQPPAQGDERPVGNERPVIVWTETASDRVLLQVERAIITANKKPGNTPIFQRGGRPVRIGTAIEAPSVINGVVRDGRTPAIFDVGKDYLDNYLTKIVRFKKIDKRSKDHEFIDCGPPPKVSPRFLDRAGEYGLPPLKAIINHPTLRPDGSILEKPGYDEVTSFFYDPCGTTFPPVIKTPSRMEAVGAASTVLKILSECAFKEEVDRSVAFALLLAAIIRPALPTAPIIVITAPTRGSGKTEIPIAAGLLADGVLPDIISLASDETEMRKIIFALLKEGASNICIDNIERPLKGETLCSVLTGPSFSGRILGESATMRVPSCATWSVTGNNAVIEGDLTRRALLCRLDAQMERPEERHYERNIRAYVLENRPQFVVAALNFLRGFIVAEDKPKLSPFGSFQEWSDLIRGAIVWAGMPDPLGSRQDIDANDPQRLALGNVLRAWHEKFGDRPQFTKDTIERQTSSPELIEAFEVAIYSPKGLSTRAVGNWIGKHEGTIINGLRFARVGDYQRSALWKVETA